MYKLFQEIGTVAEWEEKAAAIRTGLKTTVMRRTTDWAPTKKKPRKKLTKFQSRLKAWEENGSKLRRHLFESFNTCECKCTFYILILLGPNHLLVAVTGLNRAERLKTYATPLYVGRREYNKRQARRCKNFTGIKKERIMANYPVAKKVIFTCTSFIKLFTIRRITNCLHIVGLG